MAPIELDGLTGEGGGQLVRLAVSLAAITTQEVKITNIRGNRPGARGGLKSQHVTSIQWLAIMTNAEVTGLSVGSKGLTFKPQTPPSQLNQRHFKISAESGAASTLLVLQAVFPFLLFASAEDNERIVLEISGGTNVSFSLSWEYLDQVFLPTLEERFGVKVERELKTRGWSLGGQSRGEIWMSIHTVPRGQKLKFIRQPAREHPAAFEITQVDVTIITPSMEHEKLQSVLSKDIQTFWPQADVFLKNTEDSRDVARVYILLVAKSASGIRWGCDLLTSQPKKIKYPGVWLEEISGKICQKLHDEVSLGGEVDEHLQDQLICFQALCEGLSSFSRPDHGATPEEASELRQDLESLEKGEGSVRKERTSTPFGYGSLHTKTARWVVGEILPQVGFYRKGEIVRGAGISFDK